LERGVPEIIWRWVPPQRRLFGGFLAHITQFTSYRMWLRSKKTPPLLRVWKEKYLPFESGIKPKRIPR
jgi:hypothetical protein